MNQIKITAFYRFTAVADPATFKEVLLAACASRGIKGTIILAEEGINGTIAGATDQVDEFWEWLRTQKGMSEVTYKESFAQELPFLRMKVKIKKEIVTSGLDGLNPNERVGEYVKPKDWNKLIADPEVLVIDTRNEFEYAIGTFAGSVSPNTFAFREFPNYVEKLDPQQHKKVAMFCTGGIRCEKATSYMLQKGFENVYHLEGGILQYLEDVPQEESMWKGECFVFDERITVDHNLKQGKYTQCFACKHPLTEEETQSEKYSPGISCPHCYGTLSEEKLARVQERQKQVELAKKRNERHIGS